MHRQAFAKASRYFSSLTSAWTVVVAADVAGIDSFPGSIVRVVDASEDSIGG